MSQSERNQSALRLSSLGYSIIPIHHPDSLVMVADGKAGKVPFPNFSWKEYQGRRMTEVELLACLDSHSPCNFGVVTGPVSNLVVVDLDSPEAETWAADSLPHTPMSVRTGRGRHLYFSFPEGGIVKNRVHVGGRPLDIRGAGGYVVGPGSLHQSGHTYDLEGELVCPGDLPTFDPSWVRSVEATALRTGTGSIRDEWPVPIEGNRNSTCFQIACRLRKSGMPVRLAIQAIEEHFKTHGVTFTGFSDSELVRTVQSAYSNSNEVHPGHFHFPLLPADAPDSEPGEDLTSAILACPDTDSDHADLFVQKWRRRVRYCQDSKTWYHYNGQIWLPGPVTHLMEQVERQCRDVMHRQDPGGRQKPGARLSERLIKAAVNLAAGRPELGIRSAQFDKGNLLPLANGIYDLDAWQLRPYEPEDYLTKRLPFPFMDGARCPRFSAALDQYFEGDLVLIGGLQEVFGLCVSDHPSNRELFVLFGGPGTGKTTVLRVLEMLLGSYVVQLDADTLSQPDISGRVVRQLLGKRVAILSEQEQGRPLNGALIKRLSGGDKLFGREIFGKIADETNTITPSHVLIWGCNDMPAFNHRDAALRERVKVIGMHVEIPPEARRARYWEMFESELPGIFYWALEGLGRVMAKGWQSSLPPWLPSDLPPVFVPLDKLGHGPHGR